ncbi:DUF4296 domain-containing protein [uncultured Algibacter sp.]|uniref:DUF4296 domain-containing protein n=1 Tax=uncultured Algibacter sp. TaxID=298659 RepID=UPI002618BD28|nr:DUF4296 domain-containing protein [uncultured Algibacter sp.]
MILKRLIIILIVIFTTIACNKLEGPEKPKNLISKGKMVDILIDARLITSASSKNKIIMRDSGLDMNTYIYEKYNIDSLQFALSNNYYAFHVEDYEDIYTRLADSIDKLKKELKVIEGKEWKEKTKREADSLAKVYEEQKKDSLKLKETLNNSIQKDTMLFKEKKELEGLVQPISDSVPQ